MAEKGFILSAEEELKLREPIDEYIGKIQEQIDALRLDGTDKVRSLKNHIAVVKESKNLSKEEKTKIIENDKKVLEEANAVESRNKDKVNKLIAEAEDYLSKNYNSQYYNKVVNSCEAEKEAEKKEYERICAVLKEEHTAQLSKLSDPDEIKDEKYVYKNKIYDVKMAHESKCQEIKDRKHDAFLHKYHLIDLLRMSKYTFVQKRAQSIENYKYSFNLAQFLYKNGLYIVIVLIFIGLCAVTPIVKNTQLLTYTNILNILQQASPRMFLALGVAGLILLTGTDLSVGRMVGMGMVASTIIMHNGINTGGVFGHIFDFSSMGPVNRAILALVVCIVLTTFFAMIAGFFMARFKMHPFISTMANMLIIFGLGGNPEAAAVSGISVFKVTMGAFILAGILYGFGSWLECNRMIGSGSAAYGQGWDMDAIAACVVGGVSFTGGIGKISGVVTGVLIFTSLTYSLTILGIDTNLQFIFEGIIILAAVTLDCLKYVQKK